MKRIISVLLCLTIVAATMQFASAAYAASSPYLFEKVQHGKTISTTASYFTKRKNCSVSDTESVGRKVTLHRGRKFAILGKDKQGGAKVYIRIKYNDAYYYGYVNRHYISVDNSYNFKRYTVKKHNPFYNRDMVYPYYIYNDMPFYQFDQTGKNGKRVNGLRVAYSCGPHALACVLSALNGDVIYPETVMKHMSRSSINTKGTGTYLTSVASSTKSYISEHYNLNYEYKVISPYETAKYLKQGYYVIVGVENRDHLTLFTSWSHYIVLAGFDSCGNIMTVNSNLKTGLFDSFSASRINRNILNQQFYYDNTLAIKYKYNDKYKKYKSEIPSKVLKATKISEHINSMGKQTEVKCGKKITILGSQGKCYYVRYRKSGTDAFGYIPKNTTDNTVIVSAEKTSFSYTNTNKKPQITVTNVLGEKLDEDEYSLTYPDESSQIGIYSVKIKYNGDYLGKKTLEYQIVPPKTEVESVASKKKCITLKWDNSDNSLITKYEIELATDKGFKKNHKKIKVDKSHSQKTIADLDKNTKYYVRIKSYKTVDGVKLYSHNSKIKTVKTKP